MKTLILILLLIIFPSLSKAQVGNTDENPCPIGTYLFYSKIFDNITNLWNSPICAQGNGKLLFQNAIIGPSGITFNDGSNIKSYNPSVVPVTTVSNLSSFTTQRLAIVTNGSSGSDCSAGGGTFTVTCQYNGTNWTSVSSAATFPASVIDNGGQVFNIRAFGAICNGSNIDTTAIQNTLNAAAAVHGIALVPSNAANCIIDTFLNIPIGVTFAGQSGLAATVSNGSNLEFTNTTPGACTDAENPVNTGFIRFLGGSVHIIGLGFKVDSATSASCLMNIQDGTETSGVEIDHNSMIGGNATTDNNIGIYLYSVDHIHIHSNTIKDWGQPIHGGNHTWANVNIGPYNVISTGTNSSLAMVQTPSGSNCFQSRIYENVFEGFQSTNGINSACTNGMVIEGNYLGDASPTGGNWISGSSATLIGNYIDGSGLLSSGGHAINGSFNVAIGNYIYGQSLFTTGGTLTGNTFLSGPSAGCFVTMNQSAVVVSTGNNFTSSGGAANSFCHANSLTPHPIVISSNDTDATTSGIQSGVTVKYNGKIPNPFSTLPACSADIEGNSFPVTDSTTNIIGATVTGGGTNHIIATCLPNGSSVYNWIVGIPHA